MKNILKLSICLLILTINCTYSQARIGNSIKDIKDEFKDPVYKLTSGINNYGIDYISVETERASIVYYFNDENICYITIIVPDNQGAINYYVELYNNQYVIVSSTEWKMYSKKGIAKIKLKFGDDDICFFLWEFEE